MTKDPYITRKRFIKDFLDDGQYVLNKNLLMKRVVNAYHYEYRFCDYAELLWEVFFPGEFSLTELKKIGLPKFDISDEMETIDANHLTLIFTIKYLFEKRGSYVCHDSDSILVTMKDIIEGNSRCYDQHPCITMFNRIRIHNDPAQNTVVWADRNGKEIPCYCVSLSPIPDTTDAGFAHHYVSGRTFFGGRWS
jgi:hypothetical protein